MRPGGFPVLPACATEFPDARVWTGPRNLNPRGTGVLENAARDDLRVTVRSAAGRPEGGRASGPRTIPRWAGNPDPCIRRGMTELVACIHCPARIHNEHGFHDSSKFGQIFKD